MKRTLIATYLIVGVVAIAEDVVSGAPGNEVNGSVSTEREVEADDEGDSAPFTIVVKHADGWQCGGSLVSLRTALTSAWCARGRAERPPQDLWALSPPAPRDARRVARLALAVDSEGERDIDWAPGAGVQGAREGWAVAGVDLAVLELEKPFASAARARPILMATNAAECAARTVCHVVRALGRAPTLRIVDATLVGDEACSLRARGWASVRDNALCLVGPALCASDWGAGVVCAGKLCGVLSRSVAGAAVLSAADIGAAQNDTCGDTHVAQSVARWRRFLHCAHTLRACGHSGGECAQLCTERRLLDADGGSSPSTAAAPAPTRATPFVLASRPAPRRTLQFIPNVVASKEHPSTVKMHRPTRSLPATLTTSTPPHSGRPALEFEPNRPDFKAGEYGDNAVDYVGEYNGPATTRTSTSTTTEPVPVAPAGQPEASHQAEKPEMRLKSKAVVRTPASLLGIVALFVNT